MVIGHFERLLNVNNEEKAAVLTPDQFKRLLRVTEIAHLKVTKVLEHDGSQSKRHFTCQCGIH